MVRTAKDRALYASGKAAEAAQRRRWQKVVAEMRANGLDVLVFPAGEREEHQDYTLYAVPAARR
jgi:exo-beta-1,3-glucanase (GH17 family)